MPAPARTTLLVASSGGHLRQLHRLRPRLVGPEAQVAWVTFDTAQSRSLLEDEREVHYAAFVAPRDVRGVLVNLRLAGRLLRRRDVDSLVSTGSGIALSFFGLARMFGVSAHYVESAARIQGPSVTGRIVRRLPGVTAYSQYPEQARRGWHYAGSVLDGMSAEPAGRQAGSALRVLVTTGTLPYPFPRMLEAVRAALPEHAEVTWQVGRSDGRGLPGRVCETLTHAELVAEMRRCDVVVAHAGVGSALDALEAGRIPVLIPRGAAHGEHVDDHQRQIAGLLAGRGLALAVDPEELDSRHLRWAGGRRVNQTSAPGPLRLRGLPR